MAPFLAEQADQWLQQLEADHSADGAKFHPVGGYKKSGQCEYDAYVAVGANERFGVSIAIRKPNGRDPYFAIVRKSVGRRISQDKIPFSDIDTAKELFSACLRVAALRGLADTAAWSAEVDAGNP